MSAIRSMLIAYINKAFPVWIQELILQKNCHERVISLQGKPEHCCQDVISAGIANVVSPVIA